MIGNRIAIIVSCFNRKNTTLAGLKTIFDQKNLGDLELTVFLIDDASPDGTAEAVAQTFPQVRVINGSGNMWWVGAMRLGIQTAMNEGFDAYMWWNDDTPLMDDAIARLVACARQAEATSGPAIVVGSTFDPKTGICTFGGRRRVIRGIKLDFQIVAPDPVEPTLVDTMNGNIVLIPATIAKAVGNMEPNFLHRLADWDYGLRATAAGFPVLMAPGFFAPCAPNPANGTYRDKGSSFAKRWRDLMSPRGVNPKEWLIYTRRHFGWRWPLYFAAPYVNFFFNSHSASAEGSVG